MISERTKAGLSSARARGHKGGRPYKMTPAKLRLALASMGHESEHIGLLVASHAATALADARNVDQLHRAVESRDVIGQAKGILMKRYKITDHQAFLLLVKGSSRTNRKLREIADELVNSGEFITDTKQS